MSCLFHQMFEIITLMINAQLHYFNPLFKCSFVFLVAQKTHKTNHSIMQRLRITLIGQILFNQVE